MTRHPDILDPPEPLKKWLMGSLVLHAALTATLLGYNAIDHHAIQLGAPDGGGFGSVQVNSVHTIALPSTSGPTNPVASDTKSQVPTPPPTKAPPKPAAPARDLDAIAIKSRLAEKKPSPAYSEPNKFAAARRDLPNQAYTSVPQQVSDPMYQMPGGGGVGVGNNSPFGTMYGEYANRLRDQVARNWRTSDIPQQTANAPRAAITFTLHRDGSVTNARITGRSGNAALDYSAQRAILDAAPFPPLPAGFPKNDPEIEFLFELKR
ncbi:MAG TPA: energy transducer TonB [Candidatus Acidoferrales bacterium]|jgi:protein TonB|nr:energy transducer TonB [Candidatus Acidoferrales bacterium]